MKKKKLGPLWAPEAETAIIGAILQDPIRILDACASYDCRPSWFGLPMAKKAFVTITQLASNGNLIDTITVANEMSSGDDRNDVTTWLCQCVDFCVSTEHTSYYLGLLENKALLRDVKSILDGANDLMNKGTSGVELINDLVFCLEELSAEDSADRTPADVIQDIVKEAKYAKEHGSQSIRSRWDGLQKISGGYRRGKPTILAGRPGKGKTTFMCNEVEYQAECEHRVAVAEFEMQADEFYLKLTCDKAGLDSFEITNGAASDATLEKLQKTGLWVARLPIYVVDHIMSCNQFCGWVRGMVRKKQIDMVWLDYMQIMDDSSERGKKRNEVVAGWSHQIMRTIKPLHVAAGILCQLHRYQGQIKTKSDIWKSIPRLQNLKESGALEEDAFTAMLLYEDPEAGEDVSNWLKAPYVCNVAKNRSGRTGIVPFTFEKQWNRFVERSEYDVPDGL